MAEHEPNNTIDARLRQHIISRLEILKNPNHYNMGLTNREEIIYGIEELKILVRRLEIDMPPTISFEPPAWLKR